MSKQPKNFDPVWDEIYEQGHEQKAPWDTVVSFVYRNRPREKNPGDTKILEVGCGTASNLRFFAREGFQVAGLDASAKAIEKARAFFDKDGTSADLRVGDFTNLPFEDESFDLAIDRAALTCAGTLAQKAAIAEIRRVLKPGGKFLYTPYADTHASRKTGRPGPDDVMIDIKDGTLTGVGQIRFTGRTDIENFFSLGWKITDMEHETREDMLTTPEFSLHSSWRVVAEKA